MNKVKINIKRITDANESKYYRELAFLFLLKSTFKNSTIYNYKSDKAKVIKDLSLEKPKWIDLIENSANKIKTRIGTSDDL